MNFLHSPLSLNAFEAGTFLLEEIDKISKRGNFTFIQNLKFFEKIYCVYFEKFFYFNLFLLYLTVITLLGMNGLIIGLIFLPALVLGLTILVFVSFLIVNALVAGVACLLDPSPQLFVRNKHLLFSQCIDDCFVGKAESSSAASRSAFITIFAKKV